MPLLRIVKSEGLGMESKSVDITPESLKTPEGAAKVNKAAEHWHDTQANVANLSASFFREFSYLVPAADEDATELVLEIQDAIKHMKTAQEAFLRALAGRD
jgi:hypothetical protein